jgi:hypothetical protein
MNWKLPGKSIPIPDSRFPKALFGYWSNALDVDE